jgi:hypothetical protein
VREREGSNCTTERHRGMYGKREIIGRRHAACTANTFAPRVCGEKRVSHRHMISHDGETEKEQHKKPRLKIYIRRASHRFFLF